MQHFSTAIYRFTTDPTFRQQLQTDLPGTLDTHGLYLDAVEQDILAQCVASIISWRERTLQFDISEIQDVLWGL